MDSSLKQLSSVDPLVWASGRLSVRGGLFNLGGHSYQCDLVSRDKRVRVVKKGTQLGATLVYQLEAIHGLVFRRFPLGVMYMMPSEKTVERFSKLRFTPMFDGNIWLKRYLSVNNANEKVINGGNLIFVGARSQQVGGTSTKDSSALRTFECDIVYRDEVDLHDMEMVEQSKQRLNYSKVRGQVNLGSPTVPGYGIDLMYEESDQCRWVIPCGFCGKLTCIEEDFPKSIQMLGGVWCRVCVHCGRLIFVHDGRWESRYPDRDIRGYWASSFLSPRADLKEYMTRYHHSDGSALCEFERSILGRASIEAENQLSDVTVLDRCGSDGLRHYSGVDTVMGVDVGKVIHAVIGVRTGRDSYAVLNVSAVESFEELHALAARMKVRLCVMDAMPDIHASRKFQQEEPYSVFLCRYSEQMPGVPDWDSRGGGVKCNRNEWCDRVHDVFSTGKVSLPRNCPELRVFAKQLSSTAKAIITHPDTGIQKPRWIKRGDDHYFHSMLYFLLGCQRSGIIDRCGFVAPKRFRTAASTFYL